MSKKISYRVIVVYKSGTTNCSYGPFSTLAAAEACLTVLAGRADVTSASIEEIQ